MGYLEYGMALDYFDQLLSMATPKDLEVVDEIIGETEAFAVYTNLSRMIEAGRSTLSEVAASAANSAYKQHGLAWMMALARIELGAMLATFTSVPEPFASVNPTRFELAGYKSLLLDGTRTHYWAVMRDPQLKQVLRTSPENPVVLSYSRRLTLSRAMLRAAMKAGVSEFSPYQLRELANWKSDLDHLQAGMIMNIQSYLQVRLSRRSQTQDGAAYVDACAALLRAEQREVRAGTATVGPAN